jgi:hypothetical protein
MTEERFWEIVEDIGWPGTHYDIAKRRFLETHPKETALAFANLFHRFKSELYNKAGLTAISDSCADDWPEQGYAIPNFVKTLEGYRL